MKRMLSALTLVAVALLPGAVPAQEESTFSVRAIDQRIQDWQPTKEERRFDDIAWVADIRTALKLGNAHQRPVFLFTHDGRMNIGRC